MWAMMRIKGNLQERFKKFGLCLMTIVHYIQCFQCCLGCFELHKKQKVKFPMLSYVKKSLSPALQVVVNMGPDADKRKDFTGASIGCFTLCPSCIWHFLQNLISQFYILIKPNQL